MTRVLDTAIDRRRTTRRRTTFDMNELRAFGPVMETRRSTRTVIPETRRYRLFGVFSLRFVRRPPPTDRTAKLTELETRVFKIDSGALERTGGVPRSSF